MTTETTPAAVNQTATITSPIVTDGAQPVVSSPIVEPAPVVDPAVAVVTDPAAPTPDKPAGSVPEVVQKRINDLTAKRYEAERVARASEERAAAAEAKAAELLAQLAAKPATATTPDPAAKPAMTDAELEKLIDEKAAMKARANDFNKACDTIVDNGKKEFTDWDDAVKNLAMVGAIGQGASPLFLETAVELKNPQKILYHLGKNVDEADRIAKMAPTKMAMELARIEAQLNAPAPVATAPALSNAPAPVIPVAGLAKPGEKDIYDPNLSMDEYNALRAKQIADKKNRYLRA